jgi:hypothetical protein
MSSIFSRDFESKKKSQKILILGPYKPKLAKERLIQLSDCLRKHGYENAKRVADFPDTQRYDKDPDKHFTLKSRDKIKNWADVLVFVFMHKANNLGVWGELQFTVDFVKEKVHYSIELHEEGVDLSTQTRGPLKISRMYSNEFRNDRQLCELAMAFCTNVVYEFLWKT